MNNYFDNIVAFISGDIAATVMLSIVGSEWLDDIQHVGAKLLIVILSGLVGGAAGVVGKHFMQKYLNKHFVFASFALFAIALPGCKTPMAGTVTQQATTNKDSSSIRVVERYVPVMLPGDTIYFEHYIECPETSQEIKVPKPFKQRLKSKRSEGEIELNDVGKLTAIFNCNQWRDSVKVKDSVIAWLQSTRQIENTVKTVPVKYIPKAYKCAMWFSWIVIVLIVGRIALKVALNYFKIQIPFLSWLIK